MLELLREMEALRKSADASSDEESRKTARQNYQQTLSPSAFRQRRQLGVLKITED